MDNFEQEYENKGKSMALKEVQEQQQTTKSLLEINSKPSIEIANEDLVSSGWDNGQVFCKIELRNNIGDGSKEFSMPAYQNHLKKRLADFRRLLPPNSSSASCFNNNVHLFLNFIYLINFILTFFVVYF